MDNKNLTYASIGLKNSTFTYEEFEYVTANFEATKYQRNVELREMIDSNQDTIGQIKYIQAIIDDIYPDQFLISIHNDTGLFFITNASWVWSVVEHCSYDNCITINTYSTKNKADMLFYQRKKELIDEMLKASSYEVLLDEETCFRVYIGDEDNRLYLEKQLLR